MNTTETRRPLGVLVALGALLVFAPAIFGDWVWDDRYLVDGFADARGIFGAFWAGTDGISDAATGFFRPVVGASFFLLQQVFGRDPLFFHLMGLLLHGAVAFLSYRWMARRLGSRDDRSLAVVALVAALVALHPTRVESVAWISGATDLWMAFWLLLGLELWDGKGYRALGMACLVLSALSKETGFLAPLLLVTDRLLLPGRQKLRPAAVAALFSPFMLLLVLRAGFGAGQGAAAEFRLELVPAALGTYLTRVFWPAPATVQLGLVEPAGGFAVGMGLVALGLAGAAAAVAAGLWSMRREAARPWLADLLWFLVPLLPVLQIIPLGYEVLAADRFLYLPLLGIGSLAARALIAAAEHRPTLLAGAFAALSVAIAGCAWVSSRDLGRFSSDSALWDHEVELRPQHPQVLIKAADAHWRAREHDTALRLALRSWDGAADPDQWVAAAVTAAAIALESTPDWQQHQLVRIRDFLDRLALGDGEATLQLEDRRLVVKPEAELRRAVEANKILASHRAIAAARTLALDEAESQFRALIRTKDTPEVRANLVRLLAVAERGPAAEEALREGERQFPGARALATASGLLREARAVVPAGAGPLESDLARAQRMLVLGSAEAARRALAGWREQAVDSPAFLRLWIEAAIAGGDLEDARQSLAEAQRRVPAHADDWRQLEAEIAGR